MFYLSGWYSRHSLPIHVVNDNDEGSANGITKFRRSQNIISVLILLPELEHPSRVIITIWNWKTSLEKVLEWLENGQSM